MDAMTFKDLMPLIATITGGMLAVAGGIISNTYLQRRLTSKEYNKLIREKLEEAYLLGIEIDQWFQSQLTGIYSHSGPSTKHEIDLPIRKIIMLVKCYLPSASNQCDVTKKSIEEFRGIIYEYWLEVYPSHVGFRFRFFWQFSDHNGKLQRMRNYYLNEQELAELRSAHRKVREIREAYRLNAVILLGQGRGVNDVADALLMDPDTVRSYFKRYKHGGVDELLRMSYVGSEALLDAEQLHELDAHLQTELYATSAEVARYVEQRWGVRYTPSGMTALLHRLGYVSKKPKLQPGKHPPVETQNDFIAKYNDLKDTKADGDVIVFMDAMHPQHNPVLGCGWIKRGKTHPIQSNTGRQRLNINGAINIETLQLEYRFDDTIDSVSTIALFEQLQQANPSAPQIIVFCDNARYYKSSAVKDYLKDSRIKLDPLPPYSPNLNLIERFWKFFKKNVLYNTYYERFTEFRDAAKAFLSDLTPHESRLRTLLTDNFQIIGN